MNQIENRLSRADRKWKWLWMMQQTGTVGAIAIFLVLLVGVAMQRQWITSMATGVVLLTLIGVGAFLALLILGVVILARRTERRMLAGKLEQSQSELEDRLNTMVHLERYRVAPESKAFWFHRRIAAQAAEVLTARKVSVSFPLQEPLARVAIFTGLLVGTIWFYNHYNPWQTLRNTSESRAAKAGTNDLTNLALPDANALEEKGEWGEMRITDPGRDLKITKVDTVQLQIEAAANQPLVSNVWHTTVNGNQDQEHPLSPPPEPKYAAYQPVIYADEYGLNDWDVMTYFAQAHTTRGATYGSEVYFLEVRPFREDILKMTGGEGSSAYATLNQLTDLISRQQHIIRETHHFTQNPPATDKLRDQDRGKLSAGESDLSDSARHLYAEIAVTMENKPVGVVLDQLSLAGKTLLDASESLSKNNMPEGKERERLALRQLIETRKIFQKTLADHPKDFKDKTEQDEEVATAEPGDNLKEMAEFRNEEKAAREFIDQLEKKQRELTGEASTNHSRGQTNLAARQRAIKDELEQFSGLHPQMFNHATNELADATRAMEKSAKSLDKRNRSNNEDTEVAANKLEELGAALGEETVGRQLTSAYKLKKLLDQQINRLDRGGTNQAEMEKLSGQARQTTDQLKQISTNKPTSDMFGPQLADSLDDQKKQSLDRDLNQLGQAPDSAARQQMADKVRAGLQKISKAFEQSQPQAMQSAKKRDSLKEGSQSAMENGMSQLQSLINRMQANKPPSKEDMEKLMHEMQANLREGVKENYGSNDMSKKLMLVIDEELAKDTRKIELAGLKKLMAELESVSAEVKDTAQKTNAPSVSNLDPAKLPAAYRGRIEKYFKKLSETP